MAVINTYVNPAYSAAGLINNPPGQLNSFRGGSGAEHVSLYETFTVAASDSSGSIYRIFRALDPNIIPIRLQIANGVITGSSAFNLGLYYTNSAAGFGAIVGSGNQFVSAGTLVTARTSVSNPAIALDGLSNLAQYTRYRRLFEIAGETEIAPTTATTRVDAFDLCLTLTTAGGTLGSVEVLFEYVCC